MEPTDRTERLLALILVAQMKGSSLRERASLLRVAGFTNVEIADVLQTNAQVVAQSLYEARKSKRKSKPKKSGPKKSGAVPRPKKRRVGTA